jgi:DNA-binding IclR family transcriptional regulator
VPATTVGPITAHLHSAWVPLLARGYSFVVSESPGVVDRPSNTRTVRSVQNAIAVLRVLAGAGKSVSLSELARRIGLSKTSTLHLLRTLELERFVAKDDTGRYHLSWGAYEIGSAVARSVDLTRVARFHLDRLAELTGEAALLAIAEGPSVLYLDRGQSDESFNMIANVGRRSPLHTNASGKLLLAHMDPVECEAILAGGLRARTSATIVELPALLAELATIRVRGYATCWQEQEPGLNSIAAPLRDYTGHVCAALTIAGPSVRITRRAVRRLAGLVLHEAAEITESLGGTLALDLAPLRRTRA